MNTIYLCKFASHFYSLAVFYDESIQKEVEEIAKKNTKPFANWFDGVDRVYLPLGSNFDPEFSSSDNNVIMYFKENGYDVDWIGGYATKNGRKERIGKILNKLERLEILKRLQLEQRLRLRAEQLRRRFPGPTEKEIIEHIKKLFDDRRSIFENSPARKCATKKLLIVISQNAHDIAKMSTDRSWSSCMNLNGGSHSYNVYCEVGSGGLIAYLIEEDDKEIEHPLARVLIRRYANKIGESYAVMEDRVYGSAPTKFKNVVKKWLDDRQGTTNGLHTMQGGSYTDSLEKEIFPNPINLQDEVNFFIKNKINFPTALLKDIIKDTTYYEDKFVEKATNQVFGNGNWKTIRSVLSGDPIKYENINKLFANYILHHPEYIDRMIYELEESLCGMVIDEIDKINPQQANLIRIKLSDKINKEIQNKPQSVTGLEVKRLMRIKIQNTPVEKLLETSKEVIIYIEKEFPDYVKYIIVTIMDTFVKRDMVNTNVVTMLKPYIELFWLDGFMFDLITVFAFLTKAKGLAKFMLPKLRELLITTQYSSTRMECQNLITAIEEN